jgi:hypothetical protein
MSILQCTSETLLSLFGTISLLPTSPSFFTLSSTIYSFSGVATRQCPFWYRKVLLWSEKASKFCVPKCDDIVDHLSVMGRIDRAEEAQSLASLFPARHKQGQVYLALPPPEEKMLISSTDASFFLLPVVTDTTPIRCPRLIVKVFNICLHMMGHMVGRMIKSILGDNLL